MSAVLNSAGLALVTAVKLSLSFSNTCVLLIFKHFCDLKPLATVKLSTGPAPQKVRKMRKATELKEFSKEIDF